MKSTRPNPPQTGPRPVATRLPGQTWQPSIRRPYVQTEFLSKSARRAETLAAQRFRGNHTVAAQSTSAHGTPLARGIFRTIEWLPVDERNTTETRQTRIPAGAKKIRRPPRSHPGDDTSEVRGTAGHSPSMAMTRRRSGCDRADNDMRALRKHRDDFIGGTARRSSPCNRFRSMTRVENGAAACTLRRRIQPRKRCRPHLAAGKIKHGRARLQWSSFSTSSS